MIADGRTDGEDEGTGEAPGVPSEQPADESRGSDEVRRELGPGDGDDPPPDENDEPLRDN